MVHRRWTCPTCGAEYDLAPAAAPIGTEGPPPGHRQGPPATDSQCRAIYAAAKDYPGGQEAAWSVMRREFGADKPEQLNKDQASKLIDRLRGASPSW